MDIFFGNLEAMEARIAHLTPFERETVRAKVFGACSVFIPNAKFDGFVDAAISSTGVAVPAVKP